MRSLNWWSRFSSSSFPSPVVSCSATGMNPISWSVCVFLPLWNLKLDVISNTPLYLWCRFRALDALFNFLLVWYYCTLTIRESILITNGSRSVLWWLTAQSSMNDSCVGILGSWCCFHTSCFRIKGWWVFHHYVSTFLSGVMLTWSVHLISFWKCQTVKRLMLNLCLLPPGLKVFSIKCSGTSLYPTVSTKVRSLFCCGSSSSSSSDWLTAELVTLRFTDAHWHFAGLQVLFSFCSITTRAAVCTDCERWENDTPWTWQSVSRLMLFHFNTETVAAARSGLG